MDLQTQAVQIFRNLENNQSEEYLTESNKFLPKLIYVCTF